MHDSGDDDHHWMTLGEASAALAVGRLSSRELTRHTLDRIAALDGSLHAFTEVLDERALATATERDEERAAGGTRSALHGIPIAVKDLCDLTGVATRAGTTVLGHEPAAASAAVVERLEAAGAVIVGKLAQTEGAYASHHPSVTKPVNPWDASRWTGISSSGSGVATAAGLCFASLGTDTGGSIRFPSGACGLVGLKPTYGRVSRRGVYPLCASLDHVGPMTRSVRDAAVVLGAIAGEDGGDATTLADAVPDYPDACDAGVEGMTIGIDDRALAVCDDDIAAAVAGVGEQLERAGARRKQVALPDLEPAATFWSALAAPEAARSHEGVYPERGDEYGPEFKAFLDGGRAETAMLYAHAHELRVQLRARMASLHRDVDLVLTATLPAHVPPATLNMGAPDDFDLAMRMTHYVLPFNLTGQPTISFPCGFADDGLPFSAQLVGDHLGEPALLRAAAAYERETEWHRRHPDC